MKRLTQEIRTVLLGVAILALTGFVTETGYAIDVCSTGISEPPFLSFGVKSNLLLAIDNSGSMLDMAYTDPDKTQCFDDSYDSAEVYAGNYSSKDENGESIWYQWVKGPYSPWKTATEYGDTNEPKRVYVNGIIYQVQAACTSTGSTLDADTGCDWKKLVEVDIWQQGFSYAAGSFIVDRKQLYLTKDACTSSEGSDIAADSVCEWEPVDHTWRADITYAVGAVVTYNGKYFEAAGPTAPAMGAAPETTAAWTYLAEGNYVQVAGGIANIATFCDSTAAGTTKYMSDMCIRVDTTTTPNTMVAFAAKGSFLNWATASKFDIQKEILTGGKYDTNRGLVVSESRGCAGSGYVKQISLTSGGYLTLRVRGSFTEDGAPSTWDWVDSTDNTTRLEILGFSAGGFDMEACQDAIDKILTVGSGFQNDVDACLSGSTNDERDALNHALQYCWQDTHTRNLNVIADDCQGLYGSLPPNGISAYNDAYNCYGVYDKNYDHDNRVGYVGRCWNTGTGTLPSTCPPHPRNAAECNWNISDPCKYTVGTKLLRNTSGSIYTEKCTDLNQQGTDCQNNQKWAVYYTDSLTGLECNPSSPAYSGTNPEWSDLLYPTKVTKNNPADDPDYRLGIIPSNPTIGDGTDAEWWCVYQAMNDYCGDLKVPEVIDPSDLATTTTEAWNIPGNLVDSGVFSQLGIEQPLVVMKGYIAAPAAPVGILQEVKDDLRIGVMAFNNNGAKTECDATVTPGVIEPYCPPVGNQDGGQIITNILLGSADVGGGRQHIDDVVAAVNATRAITWTPLAEAMYTAIGYFTQQTALRLNADDFQVGAGLDPITNWCQENHILLITEGASTKDTNQQMIDYVTGAAAKDTDIIADRICDATLDASTYLDDLTYIARHSSATDLYGSAGNATMSTGEDSDGDGAPDMKEKQKITTHIVVSGSLRVTGTDECSPDKLLTDAAKHGDKDDDGELILGENPEKLESALLEIFNDLRQRSSAGSAASVISSSRGGEGAIYQAIFWPELKREHANTQDYSVEWVGDVHALFINDAGYMFEDTNNNRQFDLPEDVDFDGRLDVNEDANGNGLLDSGEDVDLDGHLDVAEDHNSNNVLDGDKRVVIYFDNSAAKSKGCYDAAVMTTGVCSNSKDLDEIKFIWSAADWLNSSSLLTSTNRTYLSAERKRFIFTWLDLDNDGIVDDDHDATLEDSDEIRPFVTGLALNTSATGNMPVSGTRSPVYADFGVATTGEVDGIVSWIRGNDSLIDEDVDNDNILDAGEDTNGNGRLDSIQRSRQIPVTEKGGSLMTWRLGDIIHSTPMTVSEPAEGFHLIYRDRSYANFVERYKKRRHMVYFGGNDGMLHAVNGGFYKADELKFCLTSVEDADGNCDESAGNYPLLGAEMWAYVPYNILPHLNCLTDVAYAHKYFVDLRPRIFDVKIFAQEAACTSLGTDDPACIHPNGWGTILVGGMRLGGSPANAYGVSVDVNDDVTDDNRKFISSYFVMDITNPEEPPTLLGELTQQLDNTNAQKFVDLGYSTTIPTMVIMKNPASGPLSIGGETNDWYLVFGSGPHGDDAMKGLSDQNAKVSVLPLKWLGAASSSDKKALRLPATAPVFDNPGGTFELPNSPNGFVSDLITVDFDIDPSTFDYMADAVYFGTTERDPEINADSSISLVGGGTLYRLVTRDTDGTIPPRSRYGSDVVQLPKAPHEWQMTTMLDLSKDKKPFSSAANVGYDGRNFWVYIGTGRFWDADDKTDTSQQTFFGLKEPMIFNTTTGNPTYFLWSQIEKTDNVKDDGTDNGLSANGAGDRGLLRVDDILVAQSDSATTARLSCRDNSDTLNGTAAIGDMTCIPPVIREATPPNTAFFSSLEGYIAGRKIGTCTADKVDCTDGWYKDFWPYANRERNLGQSTLLGGLVTFTTYQPFSEPCQAEGIAQLYAVYYKTGTSWYENIFGTYGVTYGNVTNKLNLGRGLATTPNLHTGSGGDEGPRAFIQTSTGEIKEIQQENLPIKGYESGRSKWKEYIP
ncbi:MAG: hypothetical protein ACD_75C01850G0006 [uncultured bacterium]|nr:MAG: hypothetical protein ACD_75C01850G0006 [uncultured bacterium]